MAWAVQEGRWPGERGRGAAEEGRQGGVWWSRGWEGASQLVEIWVPHPGPPGGGLPALGPAWACCRSESLQRKFLGAYSWEGAHR